MARKNKDVVEYLEDQHIYVVNGEIVPSVTRIVDYAMGNEYKDVPKHILKASAEYGTNVHEAIEKYVSTKEISEEYAQQVEAYKQLAKKHMLLVKDMEQIVHYQTMYAGRYDICDEFGTIWDIKTTSSLHTESLSWQLSLYYLAKYGEIKEHGYAIWLPKKGEPQVVQIQTKPLDEVLKLLDDYKNGVERTPNKLDVATVNRINEIITAEDIELFRKLDALETAVKERKEIINLQVIDYFKKNNIKSFKSDDGSLSITYVEPTTRTSLDTKKVEALFNKTGINIKNYQKVSNVKESIRISVKWVNQFYKAI